MADRVLHIHIVQAANLPTCTGMFGGRSDIYVSVQIDGHELCRTPALASRDCVRWDQWQSVHVPPGGRDICFRIKKSGLVSSSSVAGCALPLAALGPGYMEQPLFKDGDPRPGGGGVLSLSVEWSGEAPAPAPTATSQLQPAVGVPGGLVNRARTGGGSASFHEEPLPVGGSLCGGGFGGGPPEGPAVPGGLVNHAAGANAARRSVSNVAPLGGLVSQSSRLSEVPGCLTNHARSAATGLDDGDAAAPPMASSFSIRSEAASAVGLQRRLSGLANMAELGEDGTRANALPQLRALLEDLSRLEVGSDAHRQKVQRALDCLRCMSPEVLRSPDGQAAALQCADHVTAIFTNGLASADESALQSALWLAGRLPDAAAEGEEDCLQVRLRRRWATSKMEEAYGQAGMFVEPACSTVMGLQSFMDALELAEFHANQARLDGQAASEPLLERLRAPLSERLRGLSRLGETDELEASLHALGAARIDFFGLRDVQQALDRQSALRMVQGALLPAPGQDGYPELKRRARRMAVMNMQAVLADDRDGEAADVARIAMYEELLPACVEHSDESSAAALDTAFELRLPEAEVWDAVQRAVAALDSDRQDAFLYTFLPEHCKGSGRAIPAWLIDQLRALYRLPENWDVASMMAQSEAKKLLLKTPVQDQGLLRLFDSVLKQTALPHIRTRDRRGSAPQSYQIVKAVQIMNATNWQTYLQRRDEIRVECQGSRARWDADHWQDNLNGRVMSMFIKGAMEQHVVEPLQEEANEVWLLHGTSHAAADGITTDDFDIARANPHGLFGGGVYFGESISKADEYVEGKMEVVPRLGEPERTVEVFPALLCRVCLGHVYYCDDRRPDKVGLVDRCLRQQWHSVIGDRAKTSGTFREFIVYDNTQAFPAYIVYYTRTY